MLEDPLRVFVLGGMVSIVLEKGWNYRLHWIVKLLIMMQIRLFNCLQFFLVIMPSFFSRSSFLLG